MADRRNWTIPRLRAEIEAREGMPHQPFATVKGLAEKSSRWRRLRHTLKGRQTESEVEQVGLRLQLRKQQAKRATLFFSTAMRAGADASLSRPAPGRSRGRTCGAESASGQAKKVAMLGSLDHLTRQLIVHTSQTKRSSDFIAHLEQVDRLFGPQPGRQAKPVVLVEDNGPIHTSKLALARRLAARAH